MNIFFTLEGVSKVKDNKVIALYFTLGYASKVKYDYFIILHLGILGKNFMMHPIIGRDEEIRILDDLFKSNKSEFLAIYGRRRIGKTFLIRRFFEHKKTIFFNVTGTKKGKLLKQIEHFTKRIGEVFYQGAPLQAEKNWDKAFEMLTQAIRSAKNKKIVLFLDEFPWMATKNSKLLETLDYYWNQYWSFDDRIKLIICGSAASWIIEKIVHNKGGLHNRITRNIQLEPFNLNETKQFLHSIEVDLNNKQILQLYMAIGGVPYYLSKVERGMSATQIIERLAFRKKSFMLEEFDLLFASLFNDPDLYKTMVEIISTKRYGIGQQTLLKKMGKSLEGKRGLEMLRALESSGFIVGVRPKKRKGIYYRILDEYTLFYLRWIKPIKRTLLEKSLTKGYWEKTEASPAWSSWAGYTFESVCQKHLPQISKALQLSPTSIPGDWRYIPAKNSNENGAQVDLLFDRDDDVITLCEIKYTDNPFVLDKKYAEILKNKEQVYIKQEKTNKQIFWCLISANGLEKTVYSEKMIHNVVTLDNLFEN